MFFRIALCLIIFVSSSLSSIAQKSDPQTNFRSRNLQALSIQDAISQATSDIKGLIEENSALAAKFLRLGFHDCVGGCDGCVDLNNGDNAGLDVPIVALEPVYTNSDYKAAGLTRADIYVLSAITGSNVANPNSDDFFSMNYYGRTSCEDAKMPCLDKDGNDNGCTPTRGPHRDLPSPDLDTDTLLDYFNDVFDCSDQETVALLGAHTIGGVSRGNSGFDSERGWTDHNEILNNEYYVEMVGPAGDLFDGPNWTLKKVDNSDEPNIPDRYQWEKSKHNFNGPIIMMNSDMALVRTFGDCKNAVTGEVTCSFKKKNPCPAASTLPQAGLYKNDNDLWLKYFKAVLEKMLLAGYIVESECSDITCVRPVNDSSLPSASKPRRWYHSLARNTYFNIMPVARFFDLV